MITRILSSIACIICGLLMTFHCTNCVDTFVGGVMTGIGLFNVIDLVVTYVADKKRKF